MSQHDPDQTEEITPPGTDPVGDGASEDTDNGHARTPDPEPAGDPTTEETA